MENQKEPNLGDMLDYIEARSKVLDEEGKEIDPDVTASATEQFMSLIKFNGVPILPPVLTQNRREEMHSYKNHALKLESKKRARRREELHARVQSIVAGVEERRAAKAAARLAGTSDQSSPSTAKLLKQPVQETVTKLVTGSSTVTPLEGGKMPVEITISVPDNAVTGESLKSEVKVEPEKTKATTSAKALSPENPTKSKKNESASIASARSNLSYLRNMGKLSKQKSFSSQNLDRSPSGMRQNDSESSSSPGKKDSSPNSRPLLPHPPEGRPGRKSPMRQSLSTPDLRTIDFRVERDELRKPLPSRSRSPYGGRPQTAEPKISVADEKNEIKVEKGAKAKRTSDREKRVSEREKRTSNRNEQMKSSKSMKDASRKEPEKSKDIKKANKTEANRNQSSKMDRPDSVIQNPLEKLEQELSLEEQRERAMLMKQRQTELPQSKMEDGLSKEEQKQSFLSNQKQAEDFKDKVRTELDPIEMAAAELQALNITEEQALATLDSLQSDFASLEQMDCLPQDYNGIPLTTKKQQQIIHMLSKLSKALNMEDTLTSTTSSNASGEPNKDLRGYMKDDFSERKGDKQCSDGNGCVQNGAVSKDQSQAVAGELEQCADDSSLSITSGSNVTGPSQQGSIPSSASSNHSRTRMSPNGSSSILSSASSVSGSRLRMSPKSLKNTVHFSSFVTEISTSASQSMEDKISVRKLDITPVNSTNFDNPDGAEASVENVSKNLRNSGSRSVPSIPQQPESLLSKVALSPSVDSSGGSPGEFYSKRAPFETSQDSDLNTSDKENEFVPQDENSDDDYENNSGNRPTGRHPHVLNVYTANIPQGPIGNQHPAIVKSSLKSDASDSTLKGSQDKLSSQENLPKYNLTEDTQYDYNPRHDNLEGYLGKSGMDNSISSLQEEITRSYLQSQRHNTGNKVSQNDSRNRKEELKRASLKGNINQWECSPIILKPVIHNYSQKEAVETKVIGPNHGTEHLDKVELEVMDVDSDSSGQEEEDPDISGQKNVINDSEQSGMKVVNNLSEQNGSVKPSNTIPEVIESTETEEEEGKAEHIQRYLTHVHEQSLQNEEEFKSIEDNEMAAEGDVNVLDNISTSIQSFMSTLQNMNHMSHEELFQLQAKQFDVLQQQLIEQQRNQLEELFVQQRREQMNLQKEIEQYQHQIQGQEEIETINLGESLQPQVSASQPQVSTVPAWQYQAPVQSSTEPIQSQMNFNPNISQISHSTSLSTIPHQGPVDQSHSSTSTTLPQHQKKLPNNKHNQYAYIPSPILSRNPKDFDNGSDVSSILKGSPKQLLFSNQSTPVKKENKVFKPVLRSPVKPSPLHRHAARVTIPEEIFDPVMQEKFARLSATVKGYLTRRLLKTQKVQEILKTIRDTRNFAFSFQAETPMKKGTFSREDRTLLERIVAQLQAALLDIHEIFFVIPVEERMALISHSRQLEADKKLRESQRSSIESVSRSQPRLSSATLKAMERKMKAQIAEEAVFGSCEFRPKSAPPATSSPATDISGPIRRHFQSLFNRALKPLQGHISPIRPDSQVSVREIKERPKSAPNKSKKETASKNRKTASGQTSNKSGKTSSTGASKTAPSHKTKKPEKAWR